MHQSHAADRPSLLRRRRALGLTGAVVLVAGVLGGGQAAFASTVTDFTGLQADAQGGDSTSTLSNDIDARTSTLQVTWPTTAPYVLDLAGHELDLQGIQLTTAGPAYGAITVTDSVGGGRLVVSRTSGNLPTIEVDESAIFKVVDATVIATGAPGSTAATIGPAWTSGYTVAPGLVSIAGTSHVTATSSGAGAAIGGTNHGVANVKIADQAVVDVTSTGTGAALGGGASPADLAVGSVEIGDDATVNATATGRAAAIGGGYHGGGGQIVIGGFATVTATAGTSSSGTGAGIGDGEGTTASNGAQISIGGSATVTATGGAGGGAAIGGGLGAYGDNAVTIGGRAVVSATGVQGPGIGGEKNRAGTQVNISGSATVTATGGGNGAGIGGGDSESASYPSVGAALSTSGTSRLTIASSSTAISAFGPGTGSDWGTLNNNGVLILNSGQFITVPGSASASNGGTIINNGALNVDGALSTSGTLTNPGTIAVSRYGSVDNSGTIGNTGTISGAGSVANTGAIVQNGALTVAAVTGNDFKIVYDPQAGSSDTTTQLVYADTTDAAAIAIPTATPNTSGQFAGWNLAADGSGSQLSRSASIAGLAGTTSTDGTPVTLRVFALYQLDPVLPTGTNLKQGVVGTDYADTVAVTAGTNPIRYSETGAFPAGLTLDPDTGAISGRPTTMGTFTMHVTAVNARNSATHDYTIQILPTPITLKVPTTAKGTTWYLAGSTATLTIGGLQANEVYSITIGGTTVATGKASSNATLSKKVTIPRSIGDGSQVVSVAGDVHASPATARILTASVAKSLGLALSAKKVAHGKRITITVSRLYAGEAVRVVISGTHGKTAVGTATSKGGWVLTLKSGLPRGKYKVTVTGAGTSRKASASLTVS